MSMAQETRVNSGGSKLMNPVENNFDLNHVSKYTIVLNILASDFSI